MMPYSPLGTLYAASALRNAGYSVDLFDSMLAEGTSSISGRIRERSPRALVIYDDDFNFLTKMCLSNMRSAAFEMIRIGKSCGCAVIVHGSDASDHPAEYLAGGADAVIIGEGERTLVELLDVLLRGPGGDRSTIEGIAYMESGELRVTPGRRLLEDLDTLDFPARDLVDVQRYRRLWLSAHGYFSMNIVTTRGCPFHCNWCAKPVYGQVYHSRSPQNVVEEMRVLKTRYHPDHLWFCDDIFGLKPGWISGFADAVEASDAGIPFKCLSRADLLLHGDTIGHLQRAGCETVWIGAESGSQAILDAMEKGTTVEQIRESARKLHEHHIRVGFFLQYGYPGESLDDIRRTLELVRSCMPEEIGISVSYPLPGTKFHERVKRELGEKTNWVDSADLDTMVHSPFPAEFYRALHHLTHKKFGVWKGIDSLRSMVIHPLTIDRRSVRRVAAAAYHALTLPAARMRLRSAALPRNGSG